MESAPNEVWRKEQNGKTLATIQDFDDFLWFVVRHDREGSAIELDLDDVAKLREVLDVWFDHHA